LRGEEVQRIRRRGKYLVFDVGRGHLLVHLGMSGRLSIIPTERPAEKHDHVDLLLEGKSAIRLTDPRRFGAMLWIASPAEDHALLKGLGLEPFDRAFTGKALRALARNRKVSVKQFLMNGRVVSGVGNIYASEALFRAGVHPLRAAGAISAARWDRIAQAVRATLKRAVEKGGTTLRDFAAADGAPGYFLAECAVYGREGKPCPRCGGRIKAIRQGQRSTFFCPKCQR
jgi:formamidopyrimidine-DNA glycosylase